MDSLMEKVGDLYRKCNVCGHEWFRRSLRQPDPKRCPNHKCRSKDWRAPDPDESQIIDKSED